MTKPGMAIAPTSPAPGSADALADAHRRLIQNHSLQFEFSTFTPPQPPAWLEPLVRFLQAIAPILQWAFWIGVGLGVCLILYVIAMAIMRRLPSRKKKQKKTAPQEKPSYRPEAARARALLEDADKLAAEGRFSEAARVLLHRSIEDLERQFSLAVRPGYTSREIARLEPLSQLGRDVFSSIARAVETSLFGGRDLSANDYAACRQAYASFALQGRAR